MSYWCDEPVSRSEALSVTADRVAYSTITGGHLVRVVVTGVLIRPGSKPITAESP